MKQIESLEDLQIAFEEQIAVPFKIVGISEKGFYARVLEFKAFVSFRYMPFLFKSSEAWQCLLPHLMHTLFFAKIAEIQGEGEYFILNAEIPQFKKWEPEYNKNLDGIIIEKDQKFLMVEFGACFGWKYGSLKGFMHRSKRDSLKPFRSLRIGDHLSVVITDIHTSGEYYLLKGGGDYDDWETGEIQSMLNKRVCVQCKTQGVKRTYIVEGKYKGLLLRNPNNYKKSKYRFAVRGMIQELKEGQKIQGIVTKVKMESKTLEVRWDFNEEELDRDFEATRNTLGNLFNLQLDFDDEEE